MNPPAGTYIDLAAGHDFFCALADDGEVNCWGSPLNRVLEAPAGPFVEIAAVTDATCGRREDGSAACWGRDSYAILVPPAIPLTQLARTAHHRARHMCGLDAEGRPVCWGYNAHGQTWPVPPGRFTELSVGAYHTCGMREDGAAVCWGHNANSRLGCRIEAGIPLGQHLVLRALGTKASRLGLKRPHARSAAAGQARPRPCRA